MAPASPAAVLTSSRLVKWARGAPAMPTQYSRKLAANPTPEIPATNRARNVSIFGEPWQNYPVHETIRYLVIRTR